MGDPQNGWFMRENAINIDDLGVPPFMETRIWCILGCRGLPAVVTSGLPSDLAAALLGPPFFPAICVYNRMWVASRFICSILPWWCFSGAKSWLESEVDRALKLWAEVFSTSPYGWRVLKIIWLVVKPPLWKIWKSIGMMTFPIFMGK